MMTDLGTVCLRHFHSSLLCRWIRLKLNVHFRTQNYYGMLLHLQPTVLLFLQGFLIYNSFAVHV